MRESSYLEVVKVNKILYHTYESLEQDAHSLDTALNTLEKKGKRYLEAVAKMLYENRAALEEYIAESENYIDEKMENSFLKLWRINEQYLADTSCYRVIG